MISENLIINVNVILPIVLYTVCAMILFIPYSEVNIMYK